MDPIALRSQNGQMHNIFALRNKVKYRDTELLANVLILGNDRFF